MKSPFCFILTGAALLAAASPLAVHAQNRASAPAARPAAGTSIGKVGLVDVGHIFTHYEKLKANRDALQEEMKTSDVKLKQYQDQAQAITEQLKSGTIVKGSEQWTELEKQFTEINAKGQAEMSNLRREFIRKEVQMYKQIYDEVAFTVGQYAQARHYSLVLRYQRESEAEEAAGIEDPNQIMSRVNQLVVYHQDTDDITDEILKYMNEQYQRTAARPAGAVPQAPVRK